MSRDLVSGKVPLCHVTLCLTMCHCVTWPCVWQSAIVSRDLVSGKVPLCHVTLCLAK